jgi:two pore calcium channel protein
LAVEIKRFNQIFAALLKLLPALSSLGGLLWVVLSIFSALGMELYGGLITRDNAALAASAYGISGYYPLNFNDFTGGVVTLFVILVGNDWHVVMEGFVVVTSEWSRYFFIVYWVLAVVVLLNLFVAFVIEAYFKIEDELALERLRRLRFVEQLKTSSTSAERAEALADNKTKVGLVQSGSVPTGELESISALDCSYLFSDSILS